jgi:hypothetical protein
MSIRSAHELLELESYVVEQSTTTNAGGTAFHHHAPHLPGLQDS